MGIITVIIHLSGEDKKSLIIHLIIVLVQKCQSLICIFDVLNFCQVFHFDAYPCFHVRIVGSEEEFTY